jgi:hypothetical protein
VLLAAITLLLLLFYDFSRSTPSPEEQDERAIEAMIACQDEMGRRLRLAMVALADWEPGMVAHLGGDRYRVDSYVDAGPDTLQLRRIHYTCAATRMDEDEWRITTLDTLP